MQVSALQRGMTAFSRVAIAAMCALAAVFAGATAGPAAAEPKVKIVATTGMIADAARVIAGDAATVRALMGPGVDPHAYRQTRSDVVAMVRADLVLAHGLYLEAQMEDFFAQLRSRRGGADKVVIVGEAVPRDNLLAHDDYDGRFDPHVWMDTALWRHVVERVRDALTAVRPGLGDEFARRTRSYLDELAALGAYADRQLATVPEAARVLVTAHDAFNYFGRAHGFEVVGVQGISTESEAGLNRIKELVDLLVARQIGAVFVETSVSDRLIRALIEGAAARGHVVTIGGALYSDAMGPEGTYVGTYIGMIDHNTTVITRALGGSAPAAGLNGSLTLEGRASAVRGAG
ncbi:MAG: zinc ABC transporter substrate-binding protein [Pseudomonadota bacterium]